MARRNYLVEGGSGTGKSSVCRELRRRGYVAVDGDDELAYAGDPETGEPTASRGHETHVWSVDEVRRIAAEPGAAVAFFCGGSRNFAAFLDVFDAVFVLTVDAATLDERLAVRTVDDWGGTDEQRAQVRSLRAAGGDSPAGIEIDATRPLHEVVGAILELVGELG